MVLGIGVPDLNLPPAFKYLSPFAWAIDVATDGKVFAGEAGDLPNPFDPGNFGVQINWPDLGLPDPRDIHIDRKQLAKVVVGAGIALSTVAALVRGGEQVGRNLANRHVPVEGDDDQ